MTAPHFHTTDEAKSAIKKIALNTEQGHGAPTGKMGSPGYDGTTETKNVTSDKKGEDHVSHRGIKDSK